MTSERLEEMFKGDSADTYSEKISACVKGGTRGPVKRAQMGSEDPHRCERKCFVFLIMWAYHTFLSIGGTTSSGIGELD